MFWTKFSSNDLWCVDDTPKGIPVLPVGMFVLPVGIFWLQGILMLPGGFSVLRLKSDGDVQMKSNPHAMFFSLFGRRNTKMRNTR